MSQSANWELQEAIYAILISNTALTTALGGPKIYDYTPRRTKPPYITIGMSLIKDWSTSTEGGDEHIVTMHSWTDNRGRKQTDKILELTKLALANASMTMSNHKLVNMAYQFSEIRRDPDAESLHGIIRYRFVTEPIA